MAASMVCAAALLLVAACGLRSDSPVRQFVVMEAGGAVPQASEFVKNGADAAGVSFITDISALDTRSVGDRPISVMLEGTVYETTLRVADTTPPTGVPVERTLIAGQTLEASDFVTDVYDLHEVSVFFKKTPDFSWPGARDVPVVLQDESGNRTDVTSRMYVVGLKTVRVEAGQSAEPPDPRAFVDDPSGAGADMPVAFTRGIEPAWLGIPGEYDVGITLNGVELAAKLSVVDTTPPYAVAVDRAVTPGSVLEPYDFVTDVYDLSGVTARFAETPDFNTIGERVISVILVDGFGNAAEIRANLAVRESVEPPIIKGAADLTAFIGGKASYRGGVSAKDAEGVALEVEVDAEAVNLRQPGVYPVTYTAVDRHGNTASVTVNMTVFDVDAEAVIEIVDNILAYLTDDGMDQREKAREIFGWVCLNVKYVSSGEKDGVAKAAYNGFRNRQGDCYTLYAVSEMMLTRAGIENMRIERVGGRVRHYWNLVKIDGAWYHFDTTPFQMSFDTFLFTEAEAEEYTRARTDVQNCYVYNKELYPEVARERPEPPEERAEEQEEPDNG